ncbi:hypothetical protein LIER_31897 [Lithospermum erythrorhizon]|uniref:Uncharacterized protein n=1 Tax=Lithospermum erythrorhizon TaxID=34254 RepID=A0AAV3RVX5_LITER
MALTCSSHPGGASIASSGDSSPSSIVTRSLHSSLLLGLSSTTSWVAACESGSISCAPELQVILPSFLWRCLDGHGLGLVNHPSDGNAQWSSIEIPNNLSIYKGRMLTADPPSTIILLILTSHRYPVMLSGRLWSPYSSGMSSFVKVTMKLRGTSGMAWDASGVVPTSGMSSISTFQLAFLEIFWPFDANWFDDGEGYVIDGELVFLQQYGSLAGELVSSAHDQVSFLSCEKETLPNATYA